MVASERIYAVVSSLTSVRTSIILTVSGLSLFGIATWQQVKSPATPASDVIAQWPPGALVDLAKNLDLLKAEVRRGNTATAEAVQELHADLRAQHAQGSESGKISNSPQAGSPGMSASEAMSGDDAAAARDRALEQELEQERALRRSAEGKLAAADSQSSREVDLGAARERELKRELEQERALRRSAEGKLAAGGGSVQSEAGLKRSPSSTDFSGVLQHLQEWGQSAEARYWYQRAEKNQPIHPAFVRYGANWPCFWGEVLAGGDGDGSKWTCGVRLLRGPCTVYSFGSRGNINFEQALAKLGLGCEIHIYDPTSKEPAAAAALGFKYHNIGLGTRDGQEQFEGGRMFYPVLTLASAMQKNGHDHIDILKIDVEGMEHKVVAQLAQNGWPSIGQLLIEVHIDGASGHNGVSLNSLFRSIEQANLRLFHHEVNWEFGATCCIEYAFIHKDWRPETKHFDMQVASTYKDTKLAMKPQLRHMIDKYLRGYETEDQEQMER
eukprot:TRINITY_DN10764_c0_g1_i1.p1 TRINITY_DN10764_c0_g1~~TRINITY_DN10764_c0_g1_i1.p1  ORF type:complete len:497 (-),score=102.21 TRINITY_DN10764_c0_g1_i1:212-1702(-)